MSEDDLFAAIEDFKDERAAVLEFEGLLSREEAERRALLESEEFRHACEVRYVLAIQGSAARKAYLDLCEKRRGKVSADRLRETVRTAWLAERIRAANAAQREEQKA